MRSETNESRYTAMREDESEAMRREIARLRTRIADLEAQISRDERREARKLRAVR